MIQVSPGTCESQLGCDDLIAFWIVICHCRLLQGSIEQGKHRGSHPDFTATDEVLAALECVHLPDNLISISHGRVVGDQVGGGCFRGATALLLLAPLRNFALLCFKLDVLPCKVAVVALKLSIVELESPKGLYNLQNKKQTEEMGWAKHTFATVSTGS